MVRRLPSPAVLLGIMALLALAPFAVTGTPSMTDLPGHVGRYHVMLHGAASPWLRDYYAFDWRLVGNLGVDLFVRAIGPYAGAERAAWLAAALLAPLTFGGIAAVARALRGRVGPETLLAGCFVLSNPLLFGFVNYALSFALALFAFAAWVRWREAAAWRQAAVMAPLAFLVWLAHAMGWGVLGVLVAGFEAERWWRRRGVPALADAAPRLLALAPPIVLTLAWRGGSEGALFAFGDAAAARKAMNWIVVLRGGERWIDLATPGLVVTPVAWLVWRGRARIDARLATGAVALAALTFVMPTTLFGSWGADERLVPAAIVAALLSLDMRRARWVDVAALALFAARVALLTAQWHDDARRRDAALTALEQVPAGARVFVMDLAGCRTPWRADPWTHLASLAIVRRDALVNAQWYLPGAALLRVTWPREGRRWYDPSQQVAAVDCAGRIDRVALARHVAAVPRGWTHLWLLDTRGQRGLWPGHRPVHATRDSALYRLAERGGGA